MDILVSEGEITEQMRVRGSSYRLSHTHAHTHACTHTIHSLTLILRNLDGEESKEPGDTNENINPGDWNTPRLEKKRINY